MRRKQTQKNIVCGNTHMFDSEQKINYDGIVKTSITDENDKERIFGIACALAHPLRLTILEQLLTQPRSITEIAKINKITNSTAIFHLKLMEKAQLVFSRCQPNKKGKTLIFYINFSEIGISTQPKAQSDIHIFTQSAGVGEYVEACFSKYLRIATSDNIIVLEHNDAFHSCRFDAQLLCTDGGKFTYAFSNAFAKENTVRRIEFSLELCSESPYFRNDWKSEISFDVNGTEILTYISPGDFGDRRGKLNPPWWANKYTQYGQLVRIAIDREGVWLNGNLSNAITLDCLQLEKSNRLTFSVYTKDDAKYAGGFNLFGKKFGNFEQDIVLRCECEPKRCEIPPPCENAPML